MELVIDKVLINWIGIFLLECEKKNSRGNRTINSLSNEEFIHLGEVGSPGWGFYHLTSSGGDGGLGPLHHLTTWNFPIWRVIFPNLNHCYHMVCVCYILHSVYCLAPLSFKIVCFLFRENSVLEEKNFFCTYACLKMESFLQCHWLILRI